MTTEPGSAGSSLARKLSLHGALLALLLFSWFLFMALVMRFAEVTPAALVVAPQTEILDNAAPGIRLLRGGDNVFAVTGGRPGYVGALYEAGAWVVLPSLRNGCLDLRPNTK